MLWLKTDSTYFVWKEKSDYLYTFPNNLYMQVDKAVMDLGQSQKDLKQTGQAEESCQRIKESFCQDKLEQFITCRTRTWNTMNSIQYFCL